MDNEAKEDKGGWGPALRQQQSMEEANLKIIQNAAISSDPDYQLRVQLLCAYISNGMASRGTEDIPVLLEMVDNLADAFMKDNL